MNRIFFDKPKHIDEVKEQYNVRKVSLYTTPNLYPFINGISFLGNMVDVLEKRKLFPIKRKMDLHIEIYENAMLKEWNKAKRKLLDIKSKLKEVKKMDYNNAQTVNRIARIPFKYKKQFVEIANKYDLNLSLLDKIVINPTLLVNARYDSRKNLVEINPDYLKQHGMIRIGDSGELISETAKTFIHEFGHVFWYLSLTEEERRYWESLASFLQRKELTGDMTQYVVGEKKRFDGSTMYSPYYTSRDEPFVSVYARFNPREDFAECFLYYKVAPKTLERIVPKKFAFLEDKIGKRIEKDIEKQFEPEVKDRHKTRQKIIATLYGLKDNLAYKAKEHITNIYNLGRQKGAYSSGQPFDTKLEVKDKEKIQQLVARNDEYLDGFMDDITEEFDDVLFNKTPTGMVESEKSYDTTEDFDIAFDEVMDTQEYRLSLYAINGLSLALMAGMVSEAEDYYGGGYWHTTDDDRVCDGCQQLDGQWMSFEEALGEYGTNECDGNCRCGELFEISHPPQILENMVKGNGKVAAIDYHGTIMVDGKPNQVVVNKMREMKEKGYHVIVYTSGINKNPSILNGIYTWLGENKVPFDEVWQRQGKPDAEIYIDDKAINPNKEDIANVEV